MAEEKGNRWIGRVRDTFVWARNLHWILSLFPADWRAAIWAFGAGVITLIVGKLSKFSPAYAWFAVVAVVCLYAITWAVFQRLGKRSQRVTDHKPDLDKPCFAIEALDEVHTYSPQAACFFIENCGQRTARDVRFDPIFSKSGNRAIRFDKITSLSPGTKRPLTFHAGIDETHLYKGGKGHIVSFFCEDNPEHETSLAYTVTIKFLDGETPRTEQHLLDGEPLQMGGVKLKTYPVARHGSAVSHLPTARPKIVPVRWGASDDRRYGLFVRNDGEAAFDIFVGAIPIGTSRLGFWDRTYPGLTKSEGELLIESNIVLGHGGGTTGDALREEMIKAKVETVALAIMYRDLDSGYVTRFELVREFWGEGLRVTSIQQERLPQ